MAGVNMVHVPYQGAKGITDLVAGEVQAMITSPTAVTALARAGKLRMLATSGSTRAASLPDVPTVAEQGFKGFEMTQWYGLLAPSRWPRANVTKLEAEAIRATRSSIVRDKLAVDTALAVGNTGAEFDAFIKAEQARWKPVIARAQIKPDGA